MSKENQMIAGLCLALGLSAACNRARGEEDPKSDAPPAAAPACPPSEAKAPEPAPAATPAKIRFDDVRAAAHRIASALAQGDREDLAKSLDAPFRLVSGNAVAFCGKRTDGAPVGTKADGADALPKLVDCMLADRDLAEMLDKHEADVVLFNDADLDRLGYDIVENPLFRQSDDIVYAQISAQNRKTSEMVECIASFRAEGDEPRWSGLACQFDVTE